MVLQMDAEWERSGKRERPQELEDMREFGDRTQGITGHETRLPLSVKAQRRRASPSKITDAMISQNRLLRWRSGFLSELETLFGPRDPDYELGEIRSSTQGPRTVPREGSNHIADILLTPGAYGGAYSGQLAKWQMAHECLHLIDPYFHDSAEPPTIVLEEGLATWFQNQLQDRFVSCRKYILSQAARLPIHA